MKIAMHYANNPPFGIDTHDRIGLGGSESGMIRLAQKLHDLGHEIHVFNASEGIVDYGPRLKWSNVAFLHPFDRYDVMYSLRHYEVFRDNLLPNVGLRVLFLADTESYGLGDVFRAGRLDVVTSVSNWQKDKIAREEKIEDDKWIISSNGIDKVDVLSRNKVPGRCIFMGTPDRGLSTLLRYWPRIRAAVPNATLHLYSSYLGWRLGEDQNIAMTTADYQRAAEMTDLGVVNHKHGTPEEINVAMDEAEVYLYPSDFFETCCMSVLASMYRSVIPVVTSRAGLMEKVVNGVTGFCIPAYGVSTPRYENMFVDAAIEALTLDEMERDNIVHNMRRYASQFTYDTLVPKWVEEWERRLKEKGWRYENTNG